MQATRQQAKKWRTLRCNKRAPRLLLNGLFQKWAPEPLALALFVVHNWKVCEKMTSQPAKETPNLALEWYTKLF